MARNPMPYGSQSPGRRTGRGRDGPFPQAAWGQFPSRRQITKQVAIARTAYWPSGSWHAPGEAV
jgi:hypothetical protein